MNNVLDRLWTTRHELSRVRSAMEAEREKVLAPLKEQLDDITRKYAEKLYDLAQFASYLEQEAKKDVLDTGRPLENDHYKVLLVSGRKSVDVKRLEGYAAAHPEVKDFITVGKPTTRLIEKEVDAIPF